MTFTGSCFMVIKCWIDSVGRLLQNTNFLSFLYWELNFDLENITGQPVVKINSRLEPEEIFIP